VSALIARAARGPLTYRAATVHDTPALLALWAEHSGWGELSVEQWDAWYTNAPCGSAIVIIGEDATGEAMAMEVLTPCEIAINGERCSAARLSAPVIHRDLREQRMPGRTQPAVALYLASRDAAMARDIRVLFAMPDSAWVPYLVRARRTIPALMRHDAYFQCLARNLTVGAPPVADPTLRIARATTFGGEYHALWTRSCAAFPIACGVVRSPAWLAYKHADDLVLEARDDAGELHGMMAVSLRTGGITSLLSVTRDALPGVIANAVRWLMHERASGTLNIPASLSAVDVPHTRDALCAAGFAGADFRFALVADSLDEAAVPLQAVRPDAWYLTTGD
jgi:hypothetical protein